MPTAEIKRKTVAAQAILFVRKEVDPSKLQAYFTEYFPKIFGYAMQNGCAIAGNPMARYIKVGQGLWTVDAIVPLQAAAQGDGEIESGSLHGGAVAMATHTGPYEHLPETYSAIDQWIRDNPKDWQTEVYWPLAE